MIVANQNPTRGTYYIKIILMFQFHAVSRIGLRNSSPRIVLTPERKNENIKYFITSSGSRTKLVKFKVTRLRSCATAYYFFLEFYCFGTSKQDVQFHHTLHLENPPVLWEPECPNCATIIKACNLVKLKYTN